MFTDPGYQESMEARQTPFGVGGGGAVVGGGYGGGGNIGGASLFSSIMKIAQNPQVRRAAAAEAARVAPRATKAAAAAARAAKKAAAAAKKKGSKLKKKTGSKVKGVKKQGKPESRSVAAYLPSFRGTTASPSRLDALKSIVGNKLRAIQKKIKDPVARRKAMIKVIRNVGKSGAAFGIGYGATTLVDHLRSGGKSVNAQKLNDVAKNAGYNLMEDALTGKEITPKRVGNAIKKEIGKTGSKQSAALGIQQLQRLLLSKLRSRDKHQTSRGRRHRIILNRGGGGRRKPKRKTKKKKKKTVARKRRKPKRKPKSFGRGWKRRTLPVDLFE